MNPVAQLAHGIDVIDPVAVDDLQHHRLFDRQHMHLDRFDLAFIDIPGRLAAQLADLRNALAFQVGFRQTFMETHLA